MLKHILKKTWKSVSKKSSQQVIWFQGSLIQYIIPFDSIVSMLFRRNNKVLLRVSGTRDLIKGWQRNSFLDILDIWRLIKALASKV